MPVSQILLPQIFKFNTIYVCIVYGAHVATTVLPTIVEVLFNPKYDLDQTERLVLCGFYGPYFVLPVIMIVDSYIRINKYLNVVVPTRTTNPTTATKKSAKIQ